MSSTPDSSSPVDMPTSPQTERQQPDNKCHRFKVPSWFIERSVHTNARPLKATDSPHPVFNECNDETARQAQGPDRSTASLSVAGDSGKITDECREYLLAEVQDTIIGTMISPGKSSIATEQLAIIFGVHGEGLGKQTHVDGFVGELANRMHAQTMSLDFDDIEDLALDFRAQEQISDIIAGCGPDCSECWESEGPSVFEKAAAPYFAAPSPHKASTHAADRCGKAITTLFRLLPYYQGESSETLLSVDAPKCITDTTSDSALTFIYIKDARRFLGWNFLEDCRFFNRIRDMVELERKSNHRVMLLIAEPSSTSIKLQEKLRVGSESKFWIDHLPATDEKAGGSPLFTLRKNLRRLEVVLQTKGIPDVLPGVFPRSYLTWEGRLSRQAAEHLNRYRWSEKECKLISLQVLGRAAGRPAPDTADVVAVLKRRVAREIAHANARKLDARNNVSKEGDEKSDGPGLSALDLALDGIEDLCDKHEKALFKCVVDPDGLDSTFDNVILDPETKNTIRQLVALSDLRTTDASHTLLRELRVTGALFYGPPGTGKTHLVRAIAKESGLHMITLKSSDVMSKWIGETEKIIHAAFTLAAKLHPSVLFIDEADALFYRRGGDDRSHERSFLTQILQELDGLSRDAARPFVVIATNRPADLDEAFLRRLPHRVRFDLPSRAERAGILRTFVGSDDLDPAVNIESLAARTHGFSGSDLRTLCAQAALAWATEQWKERGPSVTFKPTMTEQTPTTTVAEPVPTNAGRPSVGDRGSTTPSPNDEPSTTNSNLTPTNAAPASETRDPHAPVVEAAPSRRLRLEPHHFEKALTRTFPSVSAKSLRDVEEFARRG